MSRSSALPSPVLPALLPDRGRSGDAVFRSPCGGRNGPVAVPSAAHRLLPEAAP